LKKNGKFSPRVKRGSIKKSLVDYHAKEWETLADTAVPVRSRTAGTTGSSFEKGEKK
jgi:hypothetical protein